MKLRPISNSIFYGVILLGLLPVLLLALGLLPIRFRVDERQSPVGQAAHMLGIALYAYANDNSGNYPEGKSSTEICQKLLNDGYITDPGIFCVSGSGKIKAESGQKLKPENVCWDYTAGLSTKSPGEVPLFFLTGYRVRYVPGGRAIPLPKSDWPLRSWSQWWNKEPRPGSLFQGGVAVFYVNNSTKFINRVTAPDGTSSIPNFISPDYKPDGKTYRQLTPDGVLPP